MESDGPKLWRILRWTIGEGSSTCVVCHTAYPTVETAMVNCRQMNAEYKKYKFVVVHAFE